MGGQRHHIAIGEGPSAGGSLDDIHANRMVDPGEDELHSGGSEGSPDRVPHDGVTNTGVDFNFPRASGYAENLVMEVPGSTPRRQRVSWPFSTRVERSRSRSLRRVLHQVQSPPRVLPPRPPPARNAQGFDDNRLFQVGLRRLQPCGLGRIGTPLCVPHAAPRSPTGPYTRTSWRATRAWAAHIRGSGPSCAPAAAHADCASSTV